MFKAQFYKSGSSSHGTIQLDYVGNKYDYDAILQDW
jgi:hypothetical protein